MLKSIIIENFKSFNKLVKIDFTKQNILNNKRDPLSDTNTYNGLLKGGLFIGANASGKTNILEAIIILLNGLFKDRPFRMDKCLFSNKKEGTLGYEFLIEGVEIKYIIKMKFSDDIKTENELYEVLYIDNKLAMKRDNEKASVFYNPYNANYEGLKNNILFLRTLNFNTGFNGNPILQKLVEFLSNSTIIDPNKKSIESLGKKLLLSDVINDDIKFEKINNFLMQYMNMDLEYSKSADEELNKIRKRCKNIIDKKNDDGNDNKDINFIKMLYNIADDSKFLYNVKKNFLDVKLPLSRESLGTKNLLNILPSFFHSIEKSSMLIIDEFSSAFHNELEELLIKYFFKNAKNSQIFIVSHSTNIIKNHIFRAEQIYVTEFNSSEGTKVTQVSDSKPRLSQNLERMYLGGAFGGIPKYDK